MCTMKRPKINDFFCFMLNKPRPQISIKEEINAKKSRALKLTFSWVASSDLPLSVLKMQGPSED